MPTKDAHLQFEKWAREYGPVYSLILGTSTMIVLSSDKAVKDLMDKKSGKYSHRPELYVGQELCSGGLRVLMMVRYPLPLEPHIKGTNLPSSHMALAGEA